MCGRFTLRTPLKDVAAAFGVDPATVQRELWPARYNIAPTQDVAAVRQSSAGERELARLHWGLIPPWADDPSIGNRMINARGETIATRPAYREAFRHRRCLVIADGFFEWKRGAKPKQPFYIRRPDERPLAFAGLWERWQKGELAIESCTIVTTAANALVEPLHDRMPVILDPRDYARWLDPGASEPDRLRSLLVPCPAEALTMYPVGRLVNSPRDDTPACIAPQAAGKTQGRLFD